MRYLRLRAWSKKEKAFIDDFIIDRLGNEYQYNKCEFCGDDRDVVIMQYTGLKDKNGIDIYEGDILKHAYPMKFHGEYQSFVVEWSNNLIGCKAGWDMKRLEKGLTTMYESYSLEIIGNIYENPELLNDK